MELLWAHQVQAWGEDKSFQYTFPVQSGTFQVSLNARYDYNDWAVPVAMSEASFIRYTTIGGGVHPLDVLTGTFSAENVTELEGLLLSDNCYTSVIVNAFATLLKAKSAKIIDTKVVALYRAETGRIVHTHTITMFEGGRVVSEPEAIDQTRAQAARIGHALRELQAIVSSDHTHTTAPHRIDVGTGEFVALALPQRKRSVRG